MRDTRAEAVTYLAVESGQLSFKYIWGITLSFDNFIILREWQFSNCSQRQKENLKCEFSNGDDNVNSRIIIHEILLRITSNAAHAQHLRNIKADLIRTRSFKVGNFETIMAPENT